MKIIIQSIPHKAQRYNTVGDWFTESHGEGVILVSYCPDDRYMLLVAVHELIEAILCTNDGISEAEVDNFDMQYVERDSEPGDDPRSPYRLQHCAATGIERTLAAHLGVEWAEYEEFLESLIVAREAEEKNVDESLSDA